MKAGNLVKVTRGRIGMPPGALGLIVEVVRREVDIEQPIKSWDFLYIVQLFGQTRKRRFLWRDLEVLS